MVVMAEKKQTLGFLLLVIGIASLLRSVSILWDSYLPDFSVFYQSVLHLHQGGNPYTNNQLFTQINYPPVTLLLLTPISFFDFELAQKLWLLFSVGSLALSLLLLSNVFRVSSFITILIFTASVVSFPFKFTLGMGQINIIILLCISLFFYSVTHGKKVQGGFFLALASLLKIFPAIIILSQLKKKDTKLVLSFLIFTLLYICLSLLFFGYEIHAYYIQKILLSLFSEPVGGVYYNQSITGFLSRLHIPMILLTPIRLLLLGITVVSLLKRKDNFLYISILLITTVFLLNSFTWQHHLILLVLPYYFLLSYKNASSLKIIMLCITYILLAINIKNPEFFSQTLLGNIMLSHGFFGTFLLWLMLVSYGIKNKIYNTLYEKK